MKKNSIENLDEQIKKLQNNVYTDEDAIEVLEVEDASSSENLEDTDTKIFNGELENLEDADTKIFNGEEDVVIEKGNSVDVNEKKEDNLVKEEVSEKVNTDNVGTPKNKKRIILFVFLGVILLGIIIGIVLYVKFLNDKTVDEEEVLELTEADMEKLINNYGSALESVINVYYSKQGVLLEYADATKLIEFEDSISCDIHEIYKDGKVYLDKCSINGFSTKYTYGTKQEEIVVSEDEILYVYVNKNSNISTLTKPKNENDYDKYTVHCGGVYSEPVLLGDLSDYVYYFDSSYNVQMKNYKTDEKVLSNINYKEVLPIKISENQFDLNLVAVNINDFWGIYDISSNEQVISPRYSGFLTLNMGVHGPMGFVSVVGNDLLAAWDGKNYGVINYKNNNIVIPFDNRFLQKSGNYIWSIGHDEVKNIYDLVGNKYLTEGYDEIYGMVDGIYVLVRKDNDVQVVQMDGKVLYNYGKLDNFTELNFAIAYNDGALFQFIDGSYDNGCFEVIYDHKNKTGEVKEAMCGGIAKPVLYLYPEEETNLRVTFEHPEFLETTYPKFNGSWEVKADSNGNLYDKDGNYYYALYWDEKKVHPVDFDEGYYVEKDDAITFLEEKLSYIGLNDRERNEIIMYWLPI